MNARSRHSRQNSAASNPGTNSDTETSSTQPGSTGPAPPNSVFAMAASGAPRSSLQLEEAKSPVTSPDSQLAALSSVPAHRRGHSWGSGVIEPLARGGLSSLPTSWIPRLTQAQSQWLQSLLEKVQLAQMCLGEKLISKWPVLIWTVIIEFDLSRDQT